MEWCIETEIPRRRDLKIAPFVFFGPVLINFQRELGKWLNPLALEARDSRFESGVPDQVCQGRLDVCLPISSAALASKFFDNRIYVSLSEVGRSP